MRNSLLFYLLLALVPCSLPAQPAPPRVRVAQGELVGSVTTMGPYVFKGIPFAAPPVGPLRWQPPQPPASWQRVRSATQFAPACMQPPSSAGIPASAMSEDCLYLNIWTSNLHPGIPAPVMVFIHGGGYLVGDASQPAYDGTHLAMRGAVIVTINYRLGVLGFFAHPDLTAASPHHASGNYGLLDQIAALRWVRANITTFGGDPHNVTVMGEGAGAGSIGYLMISPLATGLFDKAILESPSALFIPVPELRSQYQGISSMESIGFSVAPHIADLQSLPARELMERADAAAQKIPGSGEGAHPRLSPVTPLDGPSAPNRPWEPIVDGYVIPDQPAKLYAERRYLHVPTLAGTNTNEGSAFLTHYHPDSLASFTAWVNQAFAPCAQTVLSYYGPASPPKAPAAADSLITDAFFLHSTFLFARDTHGFLYRFTRVSPSGAKSRLGAFHTAELPYVFGHTHEPGTEFAEIDHHVSDQMMTMWTHFAFTGDPSLMNSSGWTRIGSNNEISYMDFGDTLTVKNWPDSSLITFSDPHVCKSNDFASIR